MKKNTPSSSPTSPQPASPPRASVRLWHLAVTWVFLATCLPAWADYAPPTAGLVAWWRGNGDATDSSGNGYNGTMLGGMGFTSGVFGQAFAGNSNQRMFVNDNPAFQLTSSLSIGAWVNVSAGYAVLQRGDSRGGNDPYQLSGDNAGHMVFQIQHDPDTSGKLLSASIPLHQWVQVTATLDGATGDMRLYLNGNLAAEDSTTIRPFAALNSTLSPGIAIGNTASDGDFPLVGGIDEVLLYNRALSPAEVMSLVPEPGSAMLLSVFAGLLGMWTRQRRNLGSVR
jgi:Concanavalin A-like lectin/glucanases superfamily